MGRCAPVPLEALTLPIPAFRRHEVTLTMSGGQLAEDFHDTIAGMERGDYPHDGWVDVIRFDQLLAEGFEPLHRQEKLEVLVDVGAGRPAATSGSSAAPGGPHEDESDEARAHDGAEHD
jgi:hypothetical protein